MPYVGLDQDVDNSGWTDPRRPLAPLGPMAQTPGAASPGFDPDSSDAWSWYGPRPEPGSFNPGVTSSGAAGMGSSGQPRVDTSSDRIGRGAARVMRGIAPGALAPQSPPLAQGPQAPPSPSARMTPPGASPDDPGSPDAPLQALPVSQAPSVSQGSPALPSAPHSNWAQRLALAVLASTRLAPVANQIVHPKYSEQLRQYQAELGAEGTQADIAEKQGRAAWYQAQAGEGKGRYLRVGTGVFDQASGQWVTMPTDKSNLVAIDPSVAKERGLAPLEDGTFRVPASVAAQFVKPGKEPGGMYVTPAIGQKIGIQPSEDGQYYLPPQGIGPLVTGTEPKPPTSAQLDARSQQLLAKAAQGLPNGIPPEAMADLRKLAPLIQSSSALSPEEKSELQSHLALKSSAASSGTQATIRLQGFLQGKEYPMLDTSQGNAPVMLTPADINAANAREPGRYIPSGPGTQALNKTALLEDIRGNITQTRESLSRIPEFDLATKGKIALALSNANSPGQAASSIQNLLSGAAAGSLSPEQQDYLINLTNLVENAMAMRSVLGAGQGSDELRNAIKAVIPGPRTPSNAYAGKQLEKFEATLNRLGRGIPSVPLRPELGQGGAAYKQTATGPGGHKIGSNDGQTWYDLTTGQKVQ